LGGADDQSLEGTIERVTFFNEDTGYTILKVKASSRIGSVTLVGNAASVTPGERVRARGNWAENPNYGRQFKASEIQVTTPADTDGITRYLGSGLVDGIGPVYAEKIVAKFGENVFDVIDTASRRLEEIEGIGPKRRREIKASWEKQKAVHRIMLFLHDHKISTARAVRIYQHYGDGALAVLQDNPYRLAEDIWGIGFKTADQIAGNMGISGGDPKRIAAGILHTLEASAADGHCALPRHELTERTAEILSADTKKIEQSVSTLLTGDRLRAETFADHELVYLSRLYYAESQIAKRLSSLIGQPSTYPEIDPEKAIIWATEKTGKKLSKSQSDAVKEALRHRVLVITGGPGVGKTTIVNTILEILRAKGIRPVLAAPTGRAAKRLSESTGTTTTTLHRLLDYQPARGFARNRNRPLENGDLFVLDECSMVDTPLMHAYLNALPDEAHLLLVGDVDQLPSVGPGAILKDIIDSDTVPVVRLTEIFRQAAASQIIQAAHAVNAGHPPSLSQGSDSDFFFLHRNEPQAILETILHLVRDRIPEKFGADPPADIQVLTPMKRGPLGTVALNAVLQDGLNPPNEFKTEVERFGTNFRAGDRIIQLRNNYEKEVYNGDIGKITEITSDPVLVWVRFEDGRTAAYLTTELDELSLAYATTIHKSQGSEFRFVLIPVTMAHYIMLQRNLLYTAMTRGRQLVMLVGEPKACELATRTTTSSSRITALEERLLTYNSPPS